MGILTTPYMLDTSCIWVDGCTSLYQRIYVCISREREGEGEREDAQRPDQTRPDQARAEVSVHTHDSNGKRKRTESLADELTG